MLGEIGGIWVYRPEEVDVRVHSSCYEHLKTNTFRDQTAFSDYPMPDPDYPNFPSHYQVRYRFYACSSQSAFDVLI